MKKILTLMYHRVSDDIYDFRNLTVDTRRFEQQMLYLKANYKIISAEEDWSMLDENAVVITFDDGNGDFFRNAYPILEENDIPATIFITTGAVGTEYEKWDDELERLLLFGENFPSYFSLVDSTYACTWDSRSYSERLEIYRALHWLIKHKISPNVKNDWLTQLRKWRNKNENGREYKRALSVSEIRTISKSKNISIGGHTVNHYSLPERKYLEQKDEIVNSINFLEKIIQKPIDLFSYPFGNCNEETIKVVSEININKAFLAKGGAYNPKGGDYLKIPREGVLNWDVRNFANNMRTWL